MFRSVYGDRVDYTVRPNFMLDVPIARLLVRLSSRNVYCWLGVSQASLDQGSDFIQSKSGFQL